MCIHEWFNMIAVRKSFRSLIIQERGGQGTHDDFIENWFQQPKVV